MIKENKPKDLKYMGQWVRYDLVDKIIYLLTTSISVNIRDGFYKEFGVLV